MHCNVVFKKYQADKDTGIPSSLFAPFSSSATCSPLPEFFFLEQPPHNLTAREVFLLYPLNRGSYSQDAVTPHRAHSLRLERWKGSGGPRNDQVVSVYSRARHPLSNLNHSVIPVGSSPALRIPRASCVHSRSDVVAYVFNLCFCVSMTSAHLWAISPYPIRLNPPAYIDISVPFPFSSHISLKSFFHIAFS